MDNLERMKEEIEELRESNRIMREKNEKKEKLSTWFIVSLIVICIWYIIYLSIKHS